MSESENNIVYVREVRINYHGPKRKIFKVIRESKDAAEIIKRLLPDNSREHFIGLYLNGAHEVIAYSIIATGTANACPVHPREIFQSAILSGAVSILVAHNHPSGSVEPSSADRSVTHNLKEAGELLNIKMLDHLIVTDTGHYSFKTEEGI
jgi:DNA repair protein RadC